MEENRQENNTWSWDSATGNSGTSGEPAQQTAQQAAAQPAPQPAAQQYGSYNYTNSSDNVKTEEPAKKRGGGSRVLAAVLALALVVCGCFGGYYIYRHADTGGATDSAAAESSITERTLPETGAAAATGDSAETAENTAEGTGDAAQGTTVSTSTGTNTGIVVTDVTEMVKNAMPSVVSIDNNYTAAMSTFFGYYEQEATDTGTGIIIGQTDTHFLIVTNNHVVEGAESLKVHFIDDTVAAAEIKGTNPTMDLAIISVSIENLSADTLGKISVAKLGDSDSLQLGEPVIAIGNALGYGQSVTQGVVSALNRQVEMEDGTSGTFIQTDAAINPGNSGGALLNIKGEVIGINSSKIGGSVVEGIGFAIPVTDARESINDMMTRDRVAEEDKGYFGIEVQTPVGIEGVYVASVSSGSAAEQAGMQAGDIITKVDGRTVSSREELTNVLNYYSAGTTITVTVLRRMDDRYGETELSVTLQSAEEAGINNNRNTQQQQQQTTPGEGDGSQGGNGSNGWNFGGGGENGSGWNFQGGGEDLNELFRYFFGN